MQESMTIRVRVLYSDPLVCTGLKAALGEQPDLDWTASDDARADVVIADYEQGVQLIAARKASAGPPGRIPKVLILTARDSEWEIRSALETGARGYLIQGCELAELMAGVRDVHRGIRHICAPAARRLADSISHATLTGRELDVLRLVVEGRGNKAIARDLTIAVGTVKSHLKTIFEKLGARTRTEVAALAERRGLLRPVCGQRRSG
jgi:DNA-binding NarL/FixJ family response regulator